MIAPNPPERYDNPQRLRELAEWYRQFAERAGNPAIWEARLLHARAIEDEADRLERQLAPGREG